MNFLLSLLTATVSQNVQEVAARTKRRAAFWALAWLFASTAYVCSVASLTIWLASSVGAAAAALLVAAAMVLAAAALLLTERLQRQAQRRRAARETGAGRYALIAGLAAVAPTIVRNKSLLALTAAAGAAYLLGIAASSDRSDDRFD